MQFHYFDVDTDFVDETRVVNGADCVQLQMASNMRTITVCARVNILPRLNPFIMEFPNELYKWEERFMIKFSNEFDYLKFFLLKINRSVSRLSSIRYCILGESLKSNEILFPSLYSYQKVEYIEY